MRNATCDLCGRVEEITTGGREVPDHWNVLRLAWKYAPIDKGGMTLAAMLQLQQPVYTGPFSEIVIDWNQDRQQSELVTVLEVCAGCWQLAMPEFKRAGLLRQAIKLGWPPAQTAEAIRRGGT